MTWDEETGECFLGTKEHILEQSMQVLIPIRKIFLESGRRKQQLILLGTRNPMTAPGKRRNGTNGKARGGRHNWTVGRRRSRC